MIYAGIGSRETPAHILEDMKIIGMYLAKTGAILRSGAAYGADSAFEQGCDAGNGAKEIYLPWNGFNGRRAGASVYVGVSQEVLLLAETLHPAWKRCTEGAQKLHARNCYQVLGQGLNVPADMIICWTKGGLAEGGTGQAIRLARQLNIPVFDLGSEKGMANLSAQLST